MTSLLAAAAPSWEWAGFFTGIGFTLGMVVGYTKALFELGGTVPASTLLDRESARSTDGAPDATGTQRVAEAEE